MQENSGESRIRVAVCQIALQVGDVRGNLEAARLAIVEAASSGANVVVLPELVNSGYVFRDRAEARSFAEPLAGPTTASWQHLAGEHSLTVVGGICELGDDDLVYNSAAIVDEKGVIASYRKAHLWDMEKIWFESGDRPPPVVETRFGKLSVMICYDVEFPEWVRLAALAGTDVLCLPTNWPRLQPNPGPYPAEVIRVLAEANMNLMFIAAAGRLGSERGVDWVPGSGIASPLGEWLTPLTDGRCILIGDLDLSKARRKETSSRNHQFNDRRPELYGELTSPRRNFD